MTRTTRFSILAGLLWAAACSSTDSPTAAPEPSSVGDLASLRVPAGFDFATTADVEVNLRLAPYSPAGGAKPRVRVGYPTAAGALDRVVEGWAEADGTFSAVLPVPTWRDRVLVEAEAAGGILRLLLPIRSGKVVYPGPVISSTLEAGPSLTLSSDGPQFLPADLENYPIAYISHFPSESSYGTLAFEDNWPVKGDYDFNDLVVAYHVVQYRNPAGDIVAMEMFLRPQAAGAGYPNGLGIALPVDWRRVIEIRGGRSSRLNAAGLEAGQSQAVTIAFDRVADVAGRTGMINTTGTDWLGMPEQRLLFLFRTPLKDRDLGTPPFDPFLIVNGERGREIHLSGRSGTDLANPALSQTGDDVGGYRTTNGLPWAILLPSDWAWPSERAAVNLGHLEFVNWATSGGASVPDWYMPKPTNRDYRYLYRRLQ